MSTPAVLTFKDENCAVHSVYKHWDGYPSAIPDYLEKAKMFAWPLPRFEADEFAAAFVAANKTGDGDIRLAANESSGDYNYTVTIKDGDLWVRVDDVEDDNGDPVGSWQGNLVQMRKRFPE